MREGLEAERYDVSVASSGEEGFVLMKHEMFDLLLLELMLPGRDGIEVLTTLRKRGQRKRRLSDARQGQD